jgi:hypothetical protein
MRDPRVVSGRRLARRFGIESQVRQKEGVRTTDRRELDADERTFPAFVHKASIFKRALATPALGGQTKHGLGQLGTKLTVTKSYE